MSYSELIIPSSELLGTGKGKGAEDLGAVVKIFLGTSAFSKSAANLKLKATWDAAILAETIIPLPEVVEIEANDVEAAFHEFPNGETRRTKKERRKTNYKFAENIITHSGIRSYSDQQWNIFYYTDKNYLICHEKSADLFEGLLTGSFYVDAQTTQTFDSISQTIIRIEQNDIDDWDKEFGVIYIDLFDMRELNGAVQCDLAQVSATNPGSVITVNTTVKIKGENTPLVGLPASAFLLKDESDATIAVTGAVESPSGQYAVVGSDDATTGILALKISTIGSENYKGEEFTFLVP